MITKTAIKEAKAIMHDKVDIAIDNMIESINQYVVDMQLEEIVSLNTIDAWLKESNPVIMSLPTGSTVLLSGKKGHSKLFVQFDVDKFEFLSEDTLEDAEKTLFKALDSCI